MKTEEIKDLALWIDDYYGGNGEPNQEFIDKLKSALLSNKGEGKTAAEFVKNKLYDYHLEEHDEGGYLGINEREVERMLNDFASLTSSEEVEKLKAENADYVKMLDAEHEVSLEAIAECEKLKGEIEKRKFCTEYDWKLVRENAIRMKEETFVRHYSEYDLPNVEKLKNELLEALDLRGTIPSLKARIKELESTPNVGDEFIETLFPCELGQNVEMEDGKTYEQILLANYYRRQGAKIIRDKSCLTQRGKEESDILKLSNEATRKFFRDIPQEKLDSLIKELGENSNYSGPTINEFLGLSPHSELRPSYAVEQFKTNSEIGSHHWFQTLVGQCIRMGEFIEKHPDDKRIQEFEYGKKIKDTLVFVGKNFKKINSASNEGEGKNG